MVALPAHGTIQVPIFDTVLNGTSVIGSVVGSPQDLTLHHQLRRAHGQGAPRGLRYRARRDDHIHGYTNDQSWLDGPHKDLRRARSAALSIIPTSTGAARAVGLVVPELAGALDGIAVRVPVEDGSLTDLAVVLRTAATAEEINTAFAEASEGPLNGILRVSKAPIVSRDVIGDPASCVFDPALTQAKAPW